MTEERQDQLRVFVSAYRRIHELEREIVQIRDSVSELETVFLEDHDVPGQLVVDNFFIDLTVHPTQVTKVAVV